MNQQGMIGEAGSGQSGFGAGVLVSVLMWMIFAAARAYMM